MAQISVIMPVYNAEKYLQEAIDSILRQSFTDFEFLICDDCSSDGSHEILQKAAAEDKRIKILENEKNLGCAGSLNKLWRAASSPLLVRMDADDIAMPERLRLQYDYMLARPETAAAGGQMEMIDWKGDTLGRREYALDMSVIKKSIICRSPLAHPAVIMRKAVLEELGGYAEITGCEDYDLWLKMVNNGYELGNLPETLLRYRLSPEQIKQRNMKKSLLSTLAVQRKYLFTRRFFSIRGFFYYCAGYGLLLLPNKWILKLFAGMTYK